MSVARLFGHTFMRCSQIRSANVTPRVSMFSSSVCRYAASAEAANKSSGEAKGPPNGINTPDSKAKESSDMSAKLKHIEELSAKNKELTALAGDFKDKYVRALAETENVRTRLRKEVDNAKEFSVSAFSKDVLEVADLLALALRNVEPRLKNTDAASEDDSNSTPEVNANQDPKSIEAQLRIFVEGVQMTQATLKKAFAKHGLVSYDVARGTQFDPAQHQALFQVPTEDPKLHSTVAECVKLGYTLRERVLRPAFVGVYKKV